VYTSVVVPLKIAIARAALACSAAIGAFLFHPPAWSPWLSAFSGAVLALAATFLPFSGNQTQAPPANPNIPLHILDTNILIDGRLPAIISSGFLTGTLAVPRCVLHELQQIADGADTARRTRARRGLDCIHALQTNGTLPVVILDGGSSRKPVDLRLIDLARHHQASLMTNDINLAKLAAVEGIRVLNVHQLAQALRPDLLPGEIVQLTIQREGTEPHQGVGFLADGTMVVVENARRAISQTTPVVVTRIRQSEAGKMIFARLETGPTATQTASSKASVTTTS
jgi:uncharacterized protein YacL